MWFVSYVVFSKGSGRDELFNEIVESHPLDWLASFRENGDEFYSNPRIVFYDRLPDDAPQMDKWRGVVA